MCRQPAREGCESSSDVAIYNGVAVRPHGAPPSVRFEPSVGSGEGGDGGGTQAAGEGWLRPWKHSREEQHVWPPTSERGPGRHTPAALVAPGEGGPRGGGLLDESMHAIATSRGCGCELEPRILCGRLPRLRACGE